MHRSVYTVGIIITNRLGFCKDVIHKRKKRPKYMQHDSANIAVSRKCPSMTHRSWVNNKPVHYLANVGNQERCSIC
uniref:PiggyBac transposable element-derived protein domain-containing protein n=1 Tax=Globisporangium ultimum (strain ATCC 200006 / CBS 805.95 / DAOM BR144) TaxID=431595 RepID=K3XAG6_GLOUD